VQGILSNERVSCGLICEDKRVTCGLICEDKRVTCGLICEVKFVPGQLDVLPLVVRPTEPVVVGFHVGGSGNVKATLHACITTTLYSHRYQITPNYTYHSYNRKQFSVKFIHKLIQLIIAISFRHHSAQID